MIPADQAFQTVQSVSMSHLRLIPTSPTTGTNPFKNSQIVFLLINDFFFNSVKFPDPCSLPSSFPRFVSVWTCIRAHTNISLKSTSNEPAPVLLAAQTEVLLRQRSIHSHQCDRYARHVTGGFIYTSKSLPIEYLVFGEFHPGENI